MANHARSHNSNCNRDHNSCDSKVSRHVIRDELSFCAEVEGDYDIEASDAVVQVSVDPDDPNAIPEATLPSASTLECPHHVTVIGVGTAVNVDGSGPTGDDLVNVPANTAVTFWVADSGGEDDCPFWAPDAPPPPPPVA